MVILIHVLLLVNLIKGMNFSIDQKIQDVNGFNNLTKAEQNEYNHIKAQHRFFEYTSKLENFNNITLMAITPEMAKSGDLNLVFYDHKSETYKITENIPITNKEDITDIKLLVVDSNTNEPITDKNGEFIYTSLTDAKLFYKNGEYKFDAKKDLDQNKKPFADVEEETSKKQTKNNRQ